MTRTRSGPRSLADDLRARTDEELAALLRIRPDLVVPVPVDIAQLASRAATRSSAVRVLDRLDRFTLSVVDALIVLGDPATPKAVRELLSAPKTAVDSALAALRERALTWGTQKSIHLVRVVAEIVGPHPAGLGPSAHQLLLGLPPARLATIVRDLGLQVSGDHASNAETAAAHLAAADTVQGLLDDVGPEAVSALRALSEGPPTGRIDDARRAVDRSTARTPIDRLLAAGLLIPVDDTSVVLPREVGVYLRGGVLDPSVRTEPPQPEMTGRDPDRVDRAAAAGAFNVVRQVETLLDAWSLRPPPVLRTGGLSVRDLRRLPELLDTDETGAALVAEVAYVAGLIAVSEGEDATWTPTPEYDAWQRESVADRWVTLVRGWLETSRTAGLVGSRDERDKPVPALGGEIDRPLTPEVKRTTLDVLAGLPAGAAVDVEGLVAAIRWRRPRRGGQLRDDIVRWTMREAELLGVTGMGALAGHMRPLLAEDTDEARTRLAGLLPEPLDHLLLQADLTAVVPGPLQSELARELNLLSDVESRGGATVHRFTEESVRRALDAGRTADDIHRFLESVSRTPVPQPLTYLVDDVARRHGVLRVGAASSFIRSDDHALLSEIVAAPQASALGLRRLAPTVLVSSLDGVTVLERLRQLGFAPTPESADGSVVVSRVEPRRAFGRPAPQPTLADRPTPTDAVLSAAVRALRAGDRSSSVRPADVVPGRLGRTASAQTLADLRRALEDGSTIWIGYVDHHGATSERVVDPVRLEGGWLAAFDHRSSEIRSFAVHRISGVAAVDA
ncbi:helicase C-terminal domain-containing protein [Phytoactinopolyspora halotolerans]|uniref:WYL domain-containing protein n=1 Tax=Phytoactinopolyspora halotolerans TaxID=1981512 RepID=A0A6L9S2D6_9ACTN|nr:helicase C-terminal domain-containing protein [Phytoactinopolyspora halotolerans]NED98970.1 WYL domain-containing protein [Phytoactinopolyspora halotolerans]